MKTQLQATEQVTRTGRHKQINLKQNIWKYRTISEDWIDPITTYKWYHGKDGIMFLKFMYRLSTKVPVLLKNTDSMQF